MTFIFWQNIISIHQSSFLEALANKHKVILIVENELSDIRKNSGWQLDAMKNVELIIAPKDNQIKHIISHHKQAWHGISGLHAYDLATKALKFATQIGCKNITIITESYDRIGLRGLLRLIKYSVLSLKYKNKIKAIFVTGLPARACFENLFFSTHIIFNWGYFTKQGHYKCKNAKPRGLPNLLFVGSLDVGKNLLPILPMVYKHKSLFSKFYIVGNGPLVPNLKKEIRTKTEIEYLGVLKNSEIQILMKKCDLLILPSIYDGWGAVVNEALSNGMRVLCSDNCGASILLEGKMRGGVFSHKINNFDKELIKWLKEGVVEHTDRVAIIEWCEAHISGEVAASYFLDVVNYLESKTTIRPKAPWLN